MKKLLYLLIGLTASLVSNAQNVGIGTTTPQARLHVTDSAVLFSGPVTIPGTTTYFPPASGAGSRMMWYPQKAAFRVGLVDNNNWDKDSIGRYSFALGISTLAKGVGAFASGGYSKATGGMSTSMGFFTIATGNYSTSMGNSTIAGGDNSTSMGYNTIASGGYSTSMGAYSSAIGITSTVMGAYNIARSNNSLVAGIYNDTTNTNRLFEIGNGTANNARSNALTVLTNGNIGIGTTTPGFPLNFSSALGDKLSLWGNTAGGPHYGFGIQSGLLQIHSDVAAANIAFGYGSSSAFTERMRIVNSGVDGMVLSGRILLKNGTGLITDGPGVFLYKTDNSGLLGFMGAENNQNVGFFGGPSGWGFVYDAINSRVGIGTSTPSQALQVVGNILASGTITPSDERYKKEIALIEQPIKKLNLLNGVTYHYRSSEFPGMKFSEQEQVGVIAQDVEKVFPQLVFTDDKGYKAVDYVKLIPLLIEAIKDQQKQIDELKHNSKK